MQLDNVLLAVADSLYVNGLFETVKNSVQPDALQLRENTLIQTWKSQPSKYLSAFDVDKNGKITASEWEKIRLSARGTILQQRHNTVRHIIKKPQQCNQPFIISAIPEPELLTKKRILIVLYLVVFFLLLYILITAIKAH